MELLPDLIIITGGIYLLLSLALIAGLIRLLHRNRPLPRTWEPSVTVVIPARNEEKTIARCLESVAALDYPREKLEVIVVDDHSEDATASTAAGFCEQMPRGRLLSLSRGPGTARGKIAALAAAFRTATGEIILQTDADCVVPEQWVRTMVSCFGETVGIVGGVTLAGSGLAEEKNTCFTKVQSLDLLYLLGVGAGVCGFGVPLSCFGNNLAVRRGAYDAAGGYETIPPTFTEDFALFRAVVRAGWDAGYSLEEGSVVLSRPPSSIRAFCNQRLRWLKGGLRFAGKGIVLLTAAFLLHLLVVAGLLFGVSPVVWVSAAAAAFSDAVFLALLTTRIKKRKLLLSYPLFVLYYYVYTTIFGLILPFARSLIWKGR